MFPAICTGSVLVVLLAFLSLILASAVYLGFDDAVHFLGHPKMWQRLWLTVRTATLATGLSLVVGIPVAYALSRLRFPCPHLLSTLIDLPVMVPPATVGVFLFGLVSTPPVRQLVALSGVELGHSVAGVILVQFTVTVSFCARLMKASFDAVDPRFEHVSRSLGATLPRTFFLVTLPLARRGLAASCVVVWARAVAEWEALMLFVGGTTGRTDVLPFAIYLDWNGGMMGWCVSMSLVCVMTCAAAMGTVRLIGGKSRVW